MIESLTKVFVEQPPYTGSINKYNYLVPTDKPINILSYFKTIFLKRIITTKKNQKIMDTHTLVRAYM